LCTKIRAADACGAAGHNAVSRYTLVGAALKVRTGPWSRLTGGVTVEELLQQKERCCRCQDPTANHQGETFHARRGCGARKGGISHVRSIHVLYVTGSGRASVSGRNRALAKAVPFGVGCRGADGEPSGGGAFGSPGSCSCAGTLQGRVSPYCHGIGAKAGG